MTPGTVGGRLSAGPNVMRGVHSRRVAWSPVRGGPQSRLGRMSRSVSRASAGLM
jgi:hypothetical protein